MKKYLTPLFNFCLLTGLILIGDTKAQDVGIGTLSPDYRLHISNNTSALLKLDNTTTLNTGVMSEMYFKTGLHYTGALKTIGNGAVTARLSFFTYAATNATSLIERMSILDNGYVGIGTNSPEFLLDVNGRVRVRHSPNNTAGVTFMNAANTLNRGFVGMEDDSNVGFYGYNGGGWGLTMNTASGNVSIGSQLYVNSNEFYTANIINYSGLNDYAALQAEATITAGNGVGIKGYGGETGVYGAATEAGVGSRYGLEGIGFNGAGNNYGIWANAAGGNNAIGVYGTASGGTNTWAGYFSGNVYTTGSYQGSDRKLKSDIRPLNNAIELIKELKPRTYVYKTSEYKQMELPEGNQYGLVADEVKQVFPSMVKQAVQPAKYENEDPRNGRMLADEVTFEAVNYTAMIPVMIAAMKEQQAMIETLQGRISELEAKMK